MAHREDPDARDSELDPRNGRQYGPTFNGNGNGNGTANKIVWAACAFAFGIAAYLVGAQLSQVPALQAEVARVQEHLQYLDREVDRLRKTQ
jgi:hypothetical protein